jgi:hypothetical protein
MQPTVEDTKDLASHITRYEVTTYQSVFDTDRYKLSQEKGALANQLACAEDELRILKNQYVHLTTTLSDLVVVATELAKSNQRNLGLIIETAGVEPEGVCKKVIQLFDKNGRSNRIFFDYLAKLNAKWKLGLADSSFA